jgi:hypothetical protein
MDTTLFLTLFLFAVQTAAGVAPMKWPQHTWLAGWIFYLSGIFALICSFWWFISNRDWIMLYVQPPQIIAVGLAVALGGLIWQWSKGPQNLQPLPIAAGTATPNSAVVAQSQSILIAARYYSAKNKEEVAAFLDKISDTINKPAEEMLLLAQQALGGYLFNRPNEAQLYLQRMDEIKAIAAKIEASLYDDMLANEREYRQEMNAILFPKDPLIKFRVAVDAYRNGISVWIKMRNSEDEKVRELQQLVSSSQRSFASARDEFLMWLSQRQEIIGQTRRALRS